MKNTLVMLPTMVTYRQPTIDELRVMFNRVDPRYEFTRFRSIGSCRAIVRSAGSERMVNVGSFPIEQSMTDDSVLSLIEAAGKRPALYEEALAFFKQHFDQFRLKLVVVLGSYVEIEQERHVAIICDSPLDSLVHLVLQKTDVNAHNHDKCIFLVADKAA